MSRVAVAAAVVVIGWCVSMGVGHADPAPPPPPPGPKTSFGDGTYAVGTDIMPVDVLGQLGSLLGVGAAPSGG